MGNFVHVDDSADVKLSRRSLVLGPGESASVDVSATDPRGLDPNRLPVWSGWVSIKSSHSGSLNSFNSSSVLTVPYLGVSGSMKEHQVLQPNGAVLSTLIDGWWERIHWNGGRSDYETKNDSSVSIDLPVRIYARPWNSSCARRGRAAVTTQVADRSSGK